MLFNQLKYQTWQALVSAGVFIFFALSLAVPSGYSYGAVILLITSVAYLLKRPDLSLSYEDRALVYILSGISITALAIFILHGDAPKTLDQSSRYLLFIPVLLLLLKVPPSARSLWAGVAIGVFSALGLALWQRYMQNNYRPDGFMTSAIPFGNLSLMAGILCLAGVTWSNSQLRYSYIWKLALYAGFLAGLYVSLRSGSRGGWLAIPVVLAVFLIALLKRGRLKAIAGSTLILFIAVTAAGVGMQEELTARYHKATSEIYDYSTNGDATSSVGLRLEAWRVAMISITEKPILGWSYKDYHAHLQQLAAENKAKTSIITLANTHNNFLEVWLHQGLFGLLLLLALFITPAWFFCKRLRSTDSSVQAFALGGACLSISFSIFSLTQVILGRNNGVIFFGLTLVIFWACMRNAELGVGNRAVQHNPA